MQHTFPTTTEHVEKIQEVRWYEGVIQGFDEHIIYQVNFKTITFSGTKSCFVEIEGGLREDGNVNRWQGFSTAGKRQLDDPRNQLFRQFTRLLKGLKPKVFVMENVSGMVKGKMKLIFAEIIRELRACGYQVSARLLDARYFGVPQGRQRMIFVGVRKDLKIPPSHPIAVTMPTRAIEAIGDLPTDDLLILEKPELVDLWNKCQPGKSFSTVHPKGNYFNTQKAHPYKVFPTITKTTLGKSGSGVCHWEKPGLLSIPMLKRAGSFPAGFQFIGDFKDQWARIGNSVPPLMMRSLACHIKENILDKVVN